MKIIIKNFKQEVYEIEIDETSTVLDLKKKLEEVSKNEFPFESQTLIYAGVILDNNKLLADYKIDEKKFLVVMKKKQPDDEKGKPKSTEPETAVTPPQGQTTDGESPKPETTQVPPQPPAFQATTDSITDPIQIRNVINNIVEMGYPEDQVIQALRASYNNPERAVEYLVNGISLPQTDEIVTQQEGQRLTDNSTEREEFSQTDQGITPLAFLRNDPRFQQMRRLLAEDPTLLNGIITQIGQSNPRLLQLIRENQDEFVQLLHEPDVNDSSNLTPNGPIIRVTEQEREAIERLKALGYPEDLVIQAYFACDKNEQQAANFLLSQNDDE